MVLFGQEVGMKREICLNRLRRSILLGEWSGKTWVPESPIFVIDLYLEYQPPLQKLKMVSWMLTWFYKKLNQLLGNCILKGMPFGRMTELAYTDALKLWMHWRTASDPVWIKSDSQDGRLLAYWKYMDHYQGEYISTDRTDTLPQLRNCPSLEGGRCRQGDVLTAY